jgi:Undecaprenyl pyrophosphate synthase
MKIPRHIGIIPDGNRRWAQKNNLNKHEGYNFGLNPGLEVFKLAQEYKIEEITFYGFTTDNCKRPAVQVKAFANACVEAINLLMDEKISLLVVGNSDSKNFPSSLLEFTERKNLNGGGMKVNFLINYGWDWDLENLKCNAGRKKIASSLRSSDISRIDLIIRWGGMRRLSGFLPVQSVYSDFFVVDKMWPQFSQNDFINALQWYSKQDCTLGG